MTFAALLRTFLRLLLINPLEIHLRHFFENISRWKFVLLFFSDFHHKLLIVNSSIVLILNVRIDSAHHRFRVHYHFDKFKEHFTVYFTAKPVLAFPTDKLEHVELSGHSVVTSSCLFNRLFIEVRVTDGLQTIDILFLHFPVFRVEKDCTHSTSSIVHDAYNIVQMCVLNFLHFSELLLNRDDSHSVLINRNFEILYFHIVT